MENLIVFLSVLWVISFISQRCDLILVRNGHKFLVFMSSMIGTPIHELSHAAACLLFKHKITKIEMFSPKPNGQLGVVEHSYNPMSFYQKVGLFFIGIAPVVGGSLFVKFISSTVWPGVDFDLLMDRVLSNIHQYGLLEGISNYVFWSKELHTHLFSVNGSLYLLWGFAMLSTLKHIFPSRTDIKGALLGIPTCAVLCYIAWLVNPAWVSSSANNALKYLISVLCSFGCLLIFFQLVMVLVSTCIKRISTCSNQQ
ncbi:hypothetical protein F0267_01055 [Vibrio coralliilyticus]|uniref:Uncharacterized protein n=1 Tax=Vibrio coralliilyticus TaxID=190893 RepID=A0AAN0SI32_9VIBR|nr:hypothetical protein [Vibrio coralliilyticus]AIW22705.1 hypothetical protein IX92_27020 [Vibrio coralliilyticus]NOH36810.1 hypothetical protein [Vibrio coralliilyticus]